MKKLQYPPTKKIQQLDDYHGTSVSDPFRWLEDTDSPETKDWITAQNKLTQSFLKDIPSKDNIKQRLTDLWDYKRSYAHRKFGDRYFQLCNDGLQNQDVLYTMDSLTGEKKVLLDPNKLSHDGTLALTSWEISKNGDLIAYAISDSGSDWQTWRVRDVNTKEDLSDLIEWSKFSSITWLPDSSGFYYSRYDAPLQGEDYQSINQDQIVHFHRLGTLQSDDPLIYQRPDQPEWGFDGRLSDNGKYLLFNVSQGTDRRNRFFFQDLMSNSKTIELITELESSFTFIGNDGEIFYFHTDNNAPRGRLIAIDTANPDKLNWKVIVPEGVDTMENVTMVNNQFIVIYLHDAYHLVKRFDLHGRFLGEIPLPGIGSIFSSDLESYIFGDRSHKELFFTFHSFIHPPTVVQYSFELDKCEAIDSPAIDFDPKNYITEQVFVSSKDGTQIPVFLIYKSELDNERTHPTLLYGYGGFNISITPSFMVNRLVWLELGGILAIANLRGGGEYGEEWHQAGSLQNKQNVFDDMISCAEYLITNGYTIPRQLAIEGRSNGGLLVGACLSQRPDLFGAALPAVGVMDMLRFHKFTIGWAWVSDYGSADDPAQFEVLYSYSPLHNLIKGVDYPATLVTTADHDDRVVPGHSFKFIAALQDAQTGNAPVLIRIQTRAGHGFGKPTSFLIEEYTDIIAFLVEVLDMDIT
jgi:prolyl oligopeptidase